MLGPFQFAIFVSIAALLSGCEGEVIAAGNVGLAVVPCVLLWVTVNLEKTR